MRFVKLPSQVLNGPLDRSTLHTFFSTVNSPHQFQLMDPHTVLFIAADQATKLDFAAVTSMVEFLQPNFSHSVLYQVLSGLLRQISPKPKPEPEVQAANERAAQVEPESQPKWKARVRTKLDCGRVHEEQFMLDEVSDLDRVIANSPYYLDSIKNFKIKLEHIA
jgi:hypothetical protein